MTPTNVIPTLAECPIKVGQVYASTHSGDISRGLRQRRRVVDVRLGADSFAWLQTLAARDEPYGAPSRIRLRSPRARTIPGHRLVGDADNNERDRPRPTALTAPSHPRQPLHEHLAKERPR